MRNAFARARFARGFPVETPMTSHLASPENRLIRLSKHARERVDAGEVPLAWIEATIRQPTRTRPDPRRPGVTLSFRTISEFGNRVLRGAHRPDGADILVITAFFDRGATLQ